MALDSGQSTGETNKGSNQPPKGSSAEDLPPKKESGTTPRAQEDTEPVTSQLSSAVFSAQADLDDEEGEDIYESARVTGDEAEDSQESSLHRSESNPAVEEEFQGPDTSSLAAFLLSLINITPKKPKTPTTLSGSSSYEDFESEYGESEEDTEEQEGETSPRALRRRRREEEDWAEDEGELSYRGNSSRRAEQLPSGLFVGKSTGVQTDLSGALSREGSTKEAAGTMGGARKWIMARLGITSDSAKVAGTYDEADTTDFSETEGSSRGGGLGAFRRLGARFGFGQPSTSASEAEPAKLEGRTEEAMFHERKEMPPATLQGSPEVVVSRLKSTGSGAQSPPRLPALSEESVLLKDEIRLCILQHMPAISQGREWVLLYSTAKHGISLQTLYRRGSMLSGPCLVVVGDRGGNIFGGYSSCTLQVSNKRKYQGTSDSFVFSDISGEIQAHRPSGINRYFVLCLNESLAFGGGGHFALRLEEDLLSGSTGECETYASPKLAKSEDFRISHVELWGFAHTSRYTPQSATWHEPTHTRSLHSVL